MFKKIIITICLFINFVNLYSSSYKIEFRKDVILKDIPTASFGFISSNKIIFLYETKENRGKTEIEIRDIKNAESINLIWDFIIGNNYSINNNKLLFKKAEGFQFAEGNLFVYDIINNKINSLPEFYNKTDDGRAKWMFDTSRIIFEKIKRKGIFPVKTDVYSYNLITGEEKLVKENASIVDSNGNFVLLASVEIIYKKGNYVKKLYLISNKNKVIEYFLNDELIKIFNSWTGNNHIIRLYKNNSLLFYDTYNMNLNIINLSNNKISKVENFNNNIIFDIEYDNKSDLIAIAYEKKKLFGSSREIVIGNIVNP